MKSSHPAFILQLRTNWRLRLGCYAILFILIFNLLFYLQDQNKETVSNYSRLVRQEKKLDSIAKENWWQNRALEVDKALDELLKKIPVVKNEGLARATTENTVNNLLQHHKIDRNGYEILRIEKVKQIDNCIRIIVKVYGTFEIDQFTGFLSEIERSKQMNTILTLSIVRGKRRASFNTTMDWFFRLAAE